MQIRRIFPFIYLIPCSIAYSMNSFCLLFFLVRHSFWETFFSRKCLCNLHKFRQIKTYLHRYMYIVSPCSKHFRFIQGTLVPSYTLYYYIRLFPLWFIPIMYIFFRFCINYAKKGICTEAEYLFGVIIKKASLYMQIWILLRKIWGLWLTLFFENLLLWLCN